MEKQQTSLKSVSEDALLVDVGGAVPALVAELELALFDTAAGAVTDATDGAGVRHADLYLLSHQPRQRTAHRPRLCEFRVFYVRTGTGVLLHGRAHSHQTQVPAGQSSSSAYHHQHLQIPSVST